MGRKRLSAPAYLRHKPSGQARVRIQGKDYYLGPCNSPASWKKYHQLVGQYFDGRDRPPQVIQPGCIPTAQLVAHYVEFAKEHFPLSLTQYISPKYVNQFTALLKKLVQLGVSEELVPVSVHQALNTLPGLPKDARRASRSPSEFNLFPIQTSRPSSHSTDDLACELSSLGERPTSLTYACVIDANTMHSTPSHDSTGIHALPAVAG